MTPWYASVMLAVSCMAILFGFTSLVLISLKVFSSSSIIESSVNEFQSKFKLFGIISIVSFTASNVIQFLVVLWIYIEYENDDLDTSWYPFAGTCSWMIGKVFLLLVCNARLYYTFQGEYTLQVSTTFYYILNILIVTLIPGLWIYGVVVHSFHHFVIDRIGYDGFKIGFILICSCLSIVFNKKLYKKTMQRQTVRAHKMKDIQKVVLNDDDITSSDNDIVNDVNFLDPDTKFMAAVTGRSLNYDSIHNVVSKTRDQSVYLLLDVITRYSLLVFLMCLSMVIATILYIIRSIYWVRSH